MDPMDRVDDFSFLAVMQKSPFLSTWSILSIKCRLISTIHTQSR